MRNIFTKFSRWLEYNPPGALSTRGWRLFKKEFKEKAPIRYWFRHTFRYKVYLPIFWKYKAIRDWIRFRTYDRYHVVNTGLPPGYYGAEHRMFHASFEILKEFVEVELAWHSYVWSEERKNISFLEKYVPFYRIFKPFRSKEWGLKHLDWAATLDDPKLPPHERCDHQAVSAREIRELYLWWVDIYPERKTLPIPDYDNQGMGTLGCLDEDFDPDAEDYKNFREIMVHNNNLEESWREEDTAMLVRLVKVRGHLWT